jgi:hypothetical protein
MRLKSKRAPLAVFSTVICLVILALTNYIPFGSEPDYSILRLDWHFPGGRIKICKQPTQEEIDKTPMHMRKQEYCDEKFLDYRFHVAINGETKIQEYLQPKGIKDDRPPYVHKEVKLSPGEHKLVVSFDPLNLDKEITKEVTERVTLHFESTIEAKAGRIYLLTYDQTLMKLVLK